MLESVKNNCLKNWSCWLSIPAVVLFPELKMADVQLLILKLMLFQRF